MAALLQSILGDGVKLPHDLLPDDTKLVYLTTSGHSKEFDFDDPDDELVSDWKDRELYSSLALAYYNEINGTDYKAVAVSEGRSCSENNYTPTVVIIHHGFNAVGTTDAECAESKFKNFFAVLEREQTYKGKVVVISCCIADGLKTIGCKTCDKSMCKPVDRSWLDEMVVPKSFENDSIKSVLLQYAHCLADEVNLSEKAQLRIKYPLLALAYFNKKKKKDYKLVDALPVCSSIDIEFVIHCNFIARQVSPENDVSKKLFFAELKRTDIVGGVVNWAVTACRIIHGCETRAGCLQCACRYGMRVVHPTSGFRFGRYPRKYLPHRSRGCQR